MSGPYRLGLALVRGGKIPTATQPMLQPKFHTSLRTVLEANEGEAKKLKRLGLNNLNLGCFLAA